MKRNTQIVDFYTKSSNLTTEELQEKLLKCLNSYKLFVNTINRYMNDSESNYAVKKLYQDQHLAYLKKILELEYIIYQQSKIDVSDLIEQGFVDISSNIKNLNGNILQSIYSLAKQRTIAAREPIKFIVKSIINLSEVNEILNFCVKCVLGAENTSNECINQDQVQNIVDLICNWRYHFKDTTNLNTTNLKIVTGYMRREVEKEYRFTIPQDIRLLCYKFYNQDLNLNSVGINNLIEYTKTFSFYKNYYSDKPDNIPLLLSKITHICNVFEEYGYNFRSEEYFNYNILYREELWDAIATLLKYDSTVHLLRPRFLLNLKRIEKVDPLLFSIIDNEYIVNSDISKLVDVMDNKVNSLQMISHTKNSLLEALFYNIAYRDKNYSKSAIEKLIECMTKNGFDLSKEHFVSGELLTMSPIYNILKDWQTEKISQWFSYEQWLSFEENIDKNIDKFITISNIFTDNNKLESNIDFVADEIWSNTINPLQIYFMMNGNEIEISQLGDMISIHYAKHYMQKYGFIQDIQDIILGYMHTSNELVAVIDDNNKIQSLCIINYPKEVYALLKDYVKDPSNNNYVTIPKSEGRGTSGVYQVERDEDEIGCNTKFYNSVNWSNIFEKLGIETVYVPPCPGDAFFVKWSDVRTISIDKIGVLKESCNEQFSSLFEHITGVFRNNNVDYPIMPIVGQAKTANETNEIIPLDEILSLLSDSSDSENLDYH